MKLVERSEPQAAINDVVVQVHASGFTWDELTWPLTWTDRLDRDRTPSIPGHAPLPGDVDFMVGASLPMPGLTAWQGLFEHGRLRAGQSVLAHGAAGVVGSMANRPSDLRA